MDNGCGRKHAMLSPLIGDLAVAIQGSVSKVVLSRSGTRIVGMKVGINNENSRALHHF